MSLRCSVLAAGIAVAACQPSPEITKRYAQATGLSTQPDVANITITSTATTPPAGLRFTSLPPPAMREYIAQLGSKIKDPKEFRAALAKPIVAGPAEREFDDRAVLARDVAVTVAHGAYRPADRFDGLVVTVEPVNFTFRDYTLVETAFSTVKLGTLRFEQTNSVGGELGVDMKGVVLGTLKGTGSAERKTSEEIALEKQIEKLTFNFQPTVVTLTRQGAPGLDLAGNTLVSLSVEPKDTTFEHVVVGTDLFDEKGAARSGGKASLKREWVRLPANRGEDLRAKVSASYVLRNVRSGDATIMEGDDDADYRTTVLPPVEQVLVSRDEFAAPRWAVQIEDGACARRLVTTRDLDGAEALRFSSYVEAETFARWLRIRGMASVGGLQIGCYGDRGFTTTKARQFKVRLTDER